MNSMVICLIIFAVMIILFFNRKIPMAFTSMGVIVALYVAGCVDKATVFAGFGNNNVLTMAGMFIVAAGLSRTQMVNMGPSREYWRLTFWLSSCSVSLSPACQLCLLWFILWLSACANS